MRNEAYMGTWYGLRHQKISKKKQILRPQEDWLPITVPVIIPRPLWERAHQKLAERDYERRKPEGVKFNYLISRRVRCQCGYFMHGVASKSRKGVYTRIYYYCASPTVPPATAEPGSSSVI